MPVDRRAGRARRLRGWLALWVAVLLACAPLARPPLSTVSSTRASASDEHVLSPAAATAAAVQADQPDRAVLPRLLYVEASYVPSSPKPPPVRPKTVHELVLLPEEAGTGTGDGASDKVFHPSSVGTARTPTGPPARYILI